jgi:Rad3-related DNA helicase
MNYFMKLLTGDAQHARRIFPSPFPRENVSLLLHSGIATRYTQRAESYAAIAEAIQSVCSARAGNYLVFFPSYAYLTAVVDLLKERLPEEQLLIQDRGMTEEAREAFLARFSSGSQEVLIGFAVMGGVFGEGIDLVGDRLIGAVVVGVGVPQVCLENDLIKDYFERQTGSGFAYAYQYPGFNRVLQATGRVIRTETDRGVLVLLDERFAHARYRSLFPAHWQDVQIVRSTAEIDRQLARFWNPASPASSGKVLK